MIGTHTQQSHTDTIPPVFSEENETALTPAYINANAPSVLLSTKVVTHHPKAGLNPLVDAASFLFSVISELKYTSLHRQLNRLQNELIQEINGFQ